MLIPVVVVLAVSWLGARALLLDQATDRVAEELAGEASELRLLARDGIDPATGGRFTQPGPLLQRYLEITIPDRFETMFVTVDGVVVARSKDEPPVRLDQDAALVAQIGGVQDVTYGRTTSAMGAVSYVAVPVLAAEQRGVLVVAIFDDLANQGLIGVLGTLLLVLIGALLLAAVIGWFVAGRALRPVRQLRATAQEISESDLSRRIPTRGDRSDDEIEDLAATFNRMLDRLEAAFGGQRQFIDDAGHELRTPLTIVRGHLELMEYEAPAERRRTVAIVLDELKRMGRIVRDLQTLTKSTQPGFVHLDDVAVDELTDEIFVKAGALGERQWALDAIAEGCVRADRERVTQAMMQLAANAVRHTADRDVIGIGSRLDAEGAHFWVRDTGSGVPLSDRERIFERFSRGPGKHDGVGLGLAIVRAIADAHHGAVTVTDTPGGGATFTLTLPAAGRGHVSAAREGAAT